MVFESLSNVTSKLFLITSIVATSLIGQEKANYILTFDDVPYNLDKTKELVELLEKYSFDTEAQFYLTGSGMKEQPNSVKYLIDKGINIGWHSMNHRYMKTKSDAYFENDVSEWLDVLKNIDSTYIPSLARFPYGAGTKEQINLLNKYGLKMFPAFGRSSINTYNWNIDTFDADTCNSCNSQTFENKCDNYTRGNVVVLFHQNISSFDVDVKIRPSKITNDPFIFETYLQILSKYDDSSLNDVISKK